MADSHSFDRWLGRVDHIVRQQYGGSTRGLLDLRFRAAFERWISPEAFCEEQLGLPPPTVVLDEHRGLRLLLELLFG
jgi:hypothetical protein